MGDAEEPFMSLKLNTRKLDCLIELLGQGIEASDKGIGFIAYTNLSVEAKDDFVRYHRASKEIYQGLLKDLLDGYDTVGRPVRRGVSGRRMEYKGEVEESSTGEQ